MKTIRAEIPNFVESHPQNQKYLHLTPDTLMMVSEIVQDYLEKQPEPIYPVSQNNPLSIVELIELKKYYDGFTCSVSSTGGGCKDIPAIQNAQNISKKLHTIINQFANNISL